MAEIHLPLLQRVSPSTAEVLRTCKLRAGLMGAEGAATYTIGNPKAWLGTAYHRVLERAPAIGRSARSEFERRFEEEWASAVSDVHASVMRGNANARFGSPDSWPGYFLVRAAARQRLLTFGTELERATHTEASSPPPSAVQARERRYSAAGGRLVGRIDLVDGNEIVDFKSGDIYEDSGDGDTRVRASYSRQLQLYAYLVAETDGVWPSRGRLLPPIGPAVVIDLREDACRREAADALRLLDEYNEAARSASHPESLGSPSAEHCRWCQFKLVCPAFWNAIDPSWCGQLEGEALTGRLIGSPMSIRGGKALALDVGVARSTFVATRVIVTPLEAGWHERISRASEGDCIRISSLGRRGDGSTYPTRWTQSIRENEVPMIRVPARQAPSTLVQ